MITARLIYKCPNKKAVEMALPYPMPYVRLAVAPKFNFSVALDASGMAQLASHREVLFEFFAHGDDGEMLYMEQRR